MLIINFSKLDTMSLTPLKSIAFAISLTSLILLLWVNMAALLNNPVPFEMTFISVFFVLFPVWAFTIFYMRKSTPLPDDERMNQMSRIEKIRYLLGNPPDWVMVVLAAFYGYALYSLYLFMSGGSADPEYVNGQYQVFNHGQVTLFTEAEYQEQHRLHLRSITGFFMAFFSVSTVVLAPWRRASWAPEMGNRS